MEKSDAMAAIMNQQGRVSPGTAAPAEGRSCSHLSPWVFLVSALAVKTALVTVGLVVLFHRSCGQYKTLPQNAPGWHCVPNVSASKRSSSPTEDSWMCCPEGWRCFQESCYYFSADRMPWDESQQNCSGMGSHLVVINTKAEQDFLNKEITRQNTYRREGINLHIGLRAQEVGQWHWADQTPYNETAAFWRPGEPTNAPDETCVVIHHNTEHLRNWNDVPCKTYSYRICETAAVTI
ncbi:C-type lectin domain family 4 member D-like [Cygnus atratus]|uniref:C-type lectin domain family 4 member D-like n=1 Tax=Cygnus atratus TaxID=8868 RepID=UPI0021B7754C|nr:C-type lectin domain family 4 member D-like [Cygnus atratus]